MPEPTSPCPASSCVDCQTWLGLPGMSVARVADVGTEGLVVTGVDDTSEAWEKGLREGDVITEAGQSPVAEIADLEDRIDEARDAGRTSLLLLVRRSGDPRFVALSIDEED